MGRQLKLAQVESEILQYSSSANFPQPTGSIKYLYLDQTASTLYRWDTVINQYVLLNSPATPSTSGSAEGEVYFADLVTSGRLMPCTYNNGVSGSGATLTSTGSIALGQVNQPGRIDNVIPLIDDIILVRTESLEYTNGLYSITNLGSPSSSFVLTRVSYYDTGSEIYPSQIISLRGTSNSNQTFIQQTPNPTVGSSSIKFTQSPSTATQVLPILFVDTVTTGPLPAYTYATGSTYTGFPGYQATLTAVATGSLGVIGGVTASSKLRILAVSESNSVYNGTYTVTAPGTNRSGSVAGTRWKLTRIDYWASMQPQFKEFVVSRFGATEYGSRYVLQSSSIDPTQIGISQSLIFQKYLSPSAGGGSITSAFPFTGSALITGSLGVTGSVVITGSTDTTLVRITQTGTGNTFVVEDSTNPDASPFVIDNAGRIGIGKTTPSASLDVTGSVLVTGSISILAFTSSAANIFSIRNSTNTQNLMSLSGDGRIAIGLGAQILGNTSFANRNVVIGNGACDITSVGVSENSVAIGYNASSSNSGTAIGANTQITSRQGTAIGQGAIAGEDSIALGYGARADGAAAYTSLAIGRGARASATLSGIIAVGAAANYTNALQQTLAFCVDPVGTNSQTMLLTNNANLIFRNSSQLTSGTHWDTTATNTLTIHTGSIPASNILNAFQLYSSASIVGNAVPHFRTGAGNIVKLYSQGPVTSSQGIADALTNLGLLTGSSVIVTTPTSGPFGIANSSGSYTYYSTLSSSMAAASSLTNAVVEVFANYTETGNVTITIPNGVTIQGNGYTYTNTNASVQTLFTNANNANCNIYNYNVTYAGTSTTGRCILVSAGTVDLLGTIITITDNAGTSGAYCVQLSGGGATVRNGTAIATGLANGFINQGGTLINPIARTVNGGAVYNVSGNCYNALGITSGTGIGIQGANFYKATGIASGNARGASLLGNCHDVQGFSQSNVGVYIDSGTYTNITGISNGSFGIQNQGNNCIVNNIRAISTVSNGFFTQVVTGLIINGGIIESSAALVVSCESQAFFNNVYIKSTWNSVNGHGIRAINVNTIELINCTIEVANSSANCLHATTSRSVKYIGNKWKSATTPVNANIIQGMINTQDNQGNIII